MVRLGVIYIYIYTYRLYIKDNWSYASGLLAVNAMGTQLRDLINSGLSKWTPPKKATGISRVRIRLSLSAENEQADAGRDCRTCLARPNSQARTGTGKNNHGSPVQLTTSGLATIPG